MLNNTLRNCSAILMFFLTVPASADDYSNAQSKKEALAQLDELIVALDRVKITAHDFDKGRLQSLQTIVLHTHEIVSRENLVHLAVTDAYVLLTTRIEYAGALFERIETKENKIDLIRVRDIIQQIRTVRGFDREPRLHVLAVNLKQLQQSLVDLQSLLNAEDEQLDAEIVKAIHLIGDATAVAKGSGDSFTAFKKAHLVYAQVESMYDSIERRFADREIAVAGGVIFEVSEAIAKFSDYRESLDGE